jgi:hypothetical protein
MLARARTTRAAILSLLLGLVLTAFVATPPPVEAAADTGTAYGTIRFPQGDNPGMKVLWFTKDWSYLGTEAAAGGSYSLNLAVGSYHLQFVDQRPSYQTDKYAPTDIAVTVHAGRTQKNVTMKKGAFITGTLKTKGNPAGNARVVAANEDQTSFETTADKKGRFAVGGLPEGKYSVFTYDHRHTYVGKSTYAGKLTPGGSTNLAINLTKKAGSLRVYMYTSANGVRKQVTGNPVVTAVSIATGQFWSEKVKGGNVVFQGLYPGQYKLVANGFGVWFAKTAAIEGVTVRSGTTKFGKFTYTKRGGWITGTVVDGSNPSIALGGATVQLWNADGTKLVETTSRDDGGFTLSGPLTTQSDLTIVVQPGPYTDYLGQQGQECQYEQTEHAGAFVTAGQQNDIGETTIDRLPGGNCNAPD